MAQVQFTIGQLAHSADVTVETVRYYERRGLLQQPARRASGYRQYSGEDLWRLQFVRRAKGLGFTLAEVRELLGAAQSGSVEDVLGAARAKLAEVDSQIGGLEAQRCRLNRLVRTCEEGSGDCVTLEVAAG